MSLRKFFGTVTDRAGNSVSGASVRVLVSGTSTIASLYQDDEVTAIANPTSTNAYGEYAFKVAAGLYDVSVTSGGSTISTTKVYIDAIPSAAGSALMTAVDLVAQKTILGILNNVAWSHGAGGPSVAPADGVRYYFDTESGDTYAWTDGEWVFMICLEGPAGPAGTSNPLELPVNVAETSTIRMPAGPTGSERPWNIHADLSSIYFGYDTTEGGSGINWLYHVAGEDIVFNSSGKWSSASGNEVRFGAGLCDAAVAFQVAGTQVVNTRKTGWGAPTGTATRSAFATSTVTTEQLAERLKALIDDLTSHGLIGA
jgi:hypothetical protein